MTDAKEQAALSALLASRNYREVCPDAVRRVFGEALGKYRTPKEAERAARAALHQLTGAFMTPGEMRSAREMQCLDARGDADALSRALRLHASTRERPNWEAIYDRVFFVTGRPVFALDLACGLNPLCLGALGIGALGLDVHGGAVRLVNDWARGRGWQVEAREADLLSDPPLEKADLALMMKLLPVLERQKAGAGARLLARAPARWKLVSFPTRTLGGKNVGMDRRYAGWLEQNMPPAHRIAARFSQDDELFFILEEEHG